MTEADPTYPPIQEENRPVRILNQTACLVCMFFFVVGSARWGEILAAPVTKTAAGTVMPLTRPPGYLAQPGDMMPVRPPIFIGRPSQKNLLKLERDTPFGLPKTVLQENTLRMLAIRVEFVREDPDDPTTTGDGTFDLRDSTQFKEETGHLFDAAPHDSAYFGKHIEALSRYWYTVSNGKVSIEGTVYPPEPEAVYTLPHPIAHYGKQAPEYGLTEFYFDAFRIADSVNPEINFCAYDVFCVFHAGSDRQNDWMQNTTNDLFTGFIILGQPIPVDGSTCFITEGLIMPETASQDNRIVVINALFAHEFGHQLGLIDLYSTETFITQVGDFSLMDNNAANTGGEISVNGRLRLLFGSLPVYPDAWSRAYLGMVAVDTVRVDPQAFVYAAELEEKSPQVVLVPITASEYFLIENRRIDIDDEPITAILADSVTNVILGPVDSERQFTREYDYLLPGNGILIWHVDEAVAFEDEITTDDRPNNFAANTLQWNFEKRFVWLVEADMMISFRGDEFSNLGTYTDMFSAPQRQVFSPDTPISSHSNSGARTGITIVVNSEAFLVMDFSVENDQMLPGFPVWYGKEPPPFSPSAVDIDADGTPEVFLGCGKRILGWRFDGSPLFDTNVIDVVDTVISFNGDTVFHRVALVATMPAPLVSTPLVWSVSFIGGVDETIVAAADTTNSIQVWELAEFNEDGFFDTIFAIFNVQSEYPIARPTAIWDREIAVGLVDGGVLTIDGRGDMTRYSDAGRVAGLAGTGADNAYYLRAWDPDIWHLRKVTEPGVAAWLISDTVFGPVIGDLNRDGQLNVICAGSNGTIWAFDTSLNALPGFPAQLEYEIYSAPVLGDIDADGYLEIIVTGDNLVTAVNYNGTMAEDFPVTVDRHQPTGPLRCSPIVIHWPGDPPAEILVVTADGELLSVYPAEFDQPNPPARPLGAPGLGSPAFGYDANSGTAAVWAVGGDGYLYGFALPVSAFPPNGAFSQEGYNAARTFVFPAELLPEIPDQEFLDESSVYAYPNPSDGDRVHIRYRLGTAASIAIAIYDVAGNLIQRLDGDGLENTENEITWHCGDVASGVYFCRVEARSGSGESKVVFCPVAIAR